MQDFYQERECKEMMLKEHGLQATTWQQLEHLGKWSRWLALIGVLVILYLAIGWTSELKYFSFKSMYSWANPVVRLLIISAFLVPTYYIYQLSQHLKEGFLAKDTQKLELAFTYLKVYFKYAFYMTVIPLGIALVSLVFMLLRMAVK